MEQRGSAYVEGIDRKTSIRRSAQALPASPLRGGGKEPVVLPSNDVVALAHRVLQGQTIDDRDTAAGIVDDTRSLQLTGRFGDTAARDAEHVGSELLRHQKLVRIQAVEAEEQPPAQLLVDAVMAVAHRGLRHLCDKVPACTSR